MQLIEALQNARELLETLGYKSGGDIHDDLNRAICWIQNHAPKVMAADLDADDDDDDEDQTNAPIFTGFDEYMETL